MVLSSSHCRICFLCVPLLKVLSVAYSRSFFISQLCVPCLSVATYFLVLIPPSFTQCQKFSSTCCVPVSFKSGWLAMTTTFVQFSPGPSLSLREQRPMSSFTSPCSSTIFQPGDVGIISPVSGGRMESFPLLFPTSWFFVSGHLRN